jgi:hypothetical protein
MPAYQIKPDGSIGKANDVPPGPLWELPDASGAKGKLAKDAVFRFPGKHRRTLAISNENLLIEAVVRVEKGGVIAGKHDGTNGYQLAVNGAGKAVFGLGAGGKKAELTGGSGIADGAWHHVLAEIDRADGRMTLYVDGKKDAQGQAGFADEASMDNHADFYVGRSARGKDPLVGAIDFLRVCHGTLADARTTIDELYAWQSAGPAYRDLTGHAPSGRRDVGAMERLGK